MAQSKGPHHSALQQNSLPLAKLCLHRIEAKSATNTTSEPTTKLKQQNGHKFNPFKIDENIYSVNEFSKTKPPKHCLS